MAHYDFRRNHELGYSILRERPEPKPAPPKTFTRVVWECECGYRSAGLAAMIQHQVRSHISQVKARKQVMLTFEDKP